MTKFNVGDSFEYISDIDKGFFTKNQNYEVLRVGSESVGLKDNHGKTHRISFEYLKEHFKYNNSKPTKNQRITALENEVAELRPLKQEVAELKLIVHELRDGRKTMRDVMNEVLSEPSTTNTVEDIIEFEGQKYRKVDREGRKGDIVIFRNNNTRFFTNGEPYKVAVNGCPIDNEKEAVLPLYSPGHGRTRETVDVYELIKSKPLTPNQQRAAIIEKAKGFVEDTKLKQVNRNVLSGGNHLFNTNMTTTEFVVNPEKRIVVALIRYETQKNKGVVRGKGIAKCNPFDVFNEHIGKAIALGRALGLDVSEFEQAVQPTEFVVGQEIEYTHEIRKGEKRTIESIRGYLIKMVCGRHFNLSWGNSKPIIINDTNAIYEV